MMTHAEMIAKDIWQIQQGIARTARAEYEEELKAKKAKSRTNQVARDKANARKIAKDVWKAADEAVWVATWGLIPHEEQQGAQERYAEAKARWWEEFEAKQQ